MHSDLANLQDNRANSRALATIGFKKRQTSSQEEDAHQGERLSGKEISYVFAQSSEGPTIKVKVLRPLVSMRNNVGIVKTT